MSWSGVQVPQGAPGMKLHTYAVITKSFFKKFFEFILTLMRLCDIVKYWNRILLILNRKDNIMDISEITGKTLVDVQGLKKNSKEAVFTFSDGTRYRMYHMDECCEFVSIEDVCGDPEDLIGYISFAYSTTNCECNIPMEGRFVDEKQLWTFYTIQGPLGAVVIRWYGTSNGYYSVGVSFEQIED